jgi:hypothetical protein
MKALGIEATVDHCDLGGFGSRKPDIVVTTPALKGSLPSREGMRVVTVRISSMWRGSKRRSSNRECRRSKRACARCAGG